MSNMTDIVTAIAAVIQTIAVLFTVWIAYKGLTSWQEQQIGRRRFEVAEQTLTAFYEADRIISWVRSPLSFSNEGTTRKVDNDEFESKELTKVRNKYYVGVERINEHQEFFDRFKTLKLTCRAYFGYNLEDSYDEISKAIHKVAVAARILIDTAYDVREGDRDLRDHRLKLQGDLWDTGQPGDEIKALLESAVRRVEKVCTPHLNPARTMFG